MNASPNRAMVLCAGLGTRLRPLTERLPKPAVPLCGVPAVRWTLARLSAAGVREAVVNTHWRAEAIHEAVGDPSDLGLRVEFSHEPTILGTGGGVRKVAERLAGETFYLANGKLLFDADLEGALAHHRRLGAVATMLLRPYPEGSGYGVVEVDDAGRLRRLVGRGDAAGALTRCMFTGVHVLEPDILEHLPDIEAPCINRHGYVGLLESGAVAAGHVQQAGYWAETSTPDRYLTAVTDLLDGRVDLTAFRRGGVDPFAGCTVPRPGVHIHESATVAPDAELVPPVWIGPSTRVENGAVVGPHAALEAGAVIRSGARLRKTVVWPQTTIAGNEALNGIIAVDDDRVPAR